MSYAQVASSSSQQQEKFYHENMLVCMVGKVSYEKLAEELSLWGYWKGITGFQKVDFGRRFALVFDDPDLRDRLVTSGLTIDGTHVMFNYHRRRVQMDTRIRVFVSQLPIGVTEQEIESVFLKYGETISTHKITKLMYGRRIDTGDRVIIFTRINVNIPSYVFVRGWRGFVNYSGQLRTCRICGCTGHLAKDCPRSKKESEPDSNQPVSSEP